MPGEVGICAIFATAPRRLVRARRGPRHASQIQDPLLGEYDQRAIEIAEPREFQLRSPSGPHFFDTVAPHQPTKYIAQAPGQSSGEQGVYKTAGLVRMSIQPWSTPRWFYFTDSCRVRRVKRAGFRSSLTPPNTMEKIKHALILLVFWLLSLYFSFSSLLRRQQGIVRVTL